MDYVEPQIMEAKALNSWTKGLVGYDSPVQSFIQFLKECKYQKPASGKLFIVVAGETSGVHETVLKRAMTTRSKVEVTDDPRGCGGVVVFCPVAAQLHPDVEAGMKLIPELAKGKPVVLVLMHQTRDADYEMDEPKWSENPSVKSEVHILYDETTGELLTGPRNDQAIRRLQGVFDTFGVPILPCSIS